MAGTLYIVATPIGNLKDISFRAVEALRSCEAIACEDTRHSLILLNAYEIKKPLISLHKFNEKAAAQEIVGRVKAGRNIAYISDAGMPCISDPGLELVRTALEEGISYTVIPGPSAFLSALVLSGFDSSRFLFLGFLPQKKSERQRLLENVRDLPFTLIFYCPPHDIDKDIKSVYSVLGERRFAAVKEITKIHERVIFGKLSEGISEEIRGEYVLICEGAGEVESPLNALTIEEHIEHYIKLGRSKMEAIKLVAKERSLPKNEVYKYTLQDREKE
jgi:16S rRNA (cytidine1402-2'-O)-methyltransferase